MTLYFLLMCVRFEVTIYKLFFFRMQYRYAISLHRNRSELPRRFSLLEATPIDSAPALCQIMPALIYI